MELKKLELLRDLGTDLMKINRVACASGFTFSDTMADMTMILDCVGKALEKIGELQNLIIKEIKDEKENDKRN